MPQNINSAVKDTLPFGRVQVVDKLRCVVFVTLLIPSQKKIDYDVGLIKVWF